MKVFISWSGERSHRVALLLKTWIKCVLQASDPWISSENIDRGSVWFSNISASLGECVVGIVCLTKSNLKAPWILFEAGALAKGLNNTRVCTFLVDLQPSDIEDPLAQFNHTLPTRDSLKQLVKTLNSQLGERALPEDVFGKVFDKYWPDFENEHKSILSTTNGETADKKMRSSEDILSEVLATVRGLDKRMRIIENDNFENDGIATRVTGSCSGGMTRSAKTMTELLREHRKPTTVGEVADYIDKSSKEDPGGLL